MKKIVTHLTRSMIAGLIALLPVGGTVLSVLYLESVLRDAWNGIEPLQPYYFPGLGLIAAALLIYAVGLSVSTFLGRWLIGLIDMILDRLPLLGTLYQTLKQILGYGEGEEAVFQRAVYVRSRENDAEELGLVTSAVPGPGGKERVIVFVPGSPNPAAGRLLLVDPAALRPAPLTVNKALTALVSLGKSEMSAEPQ